MQVKSIAVSEMAGMAILNAVLAGDDYKHEISTLPQDELYDVTIRPAKHRRSLDANAYCWVLLNKLAPVLSTPYAPVSPIDIYRDQIKHVGGNVNIVCVQEKAADDLERAWTQPGDGKKHLGRIVERTESKLPNCVTMFLYMGSSEYDKAQMGRLIDLIVDECKQQGIETLPPEKIHDLKEEWGEQENKNAGDNASNKD